MSEMIDRVAKAIEAVLEKPRYIVRITLSSDMNGVSWQLWEGDNKICSSNNHAHIDKMCDELNNKYAARKAVEALKQDYNCIWNDWLDAILASEGDNDRIEKATIQTNMPTLRKSL